MKVAYLFVTSGGCFPDVYSALSGNPPDLVISL
jgi:hypothetical protein